MNGRREEKSSTCYFHQKQDERLLILVSKQRKQNSSASLTPSPAKGNSQRIQDFTQKKRPFNLPKIFTFSSLLLNRFEVRHSKSDHTDDHDASTSQEDSFISIKFGDNGAASWDKRKVSKVTLEHCRISWNHYKMKNELPKDTNKTVIEHQKPRGALRWRKRIGQLFQIVRLRWSTVCHVSSKVEGAKVSKAWIRSLTKKKAEKTN